MIKVFTLIILMLPAEGGTTFEEYLKTEVRTCPTTAELRAMQARLLQYYAEVRILYSCEEKHKEKHKHKL